MAEPSSLANMIKEQDRDAMADLLGSTSGRWFIARLLEICGVWPPKYGDWTSAEAAAIQEGARRIGIHLAQRAEEAQGGSEAFWKMMAEYQEKLAWIKEITKEGKGTCRYE
jgi:hypothetical protein